MSTAAASAAAIAAGGMDGAQPRCSDIAQVAPVPSSTPATPPIRASSRDSTRNWAATWRRAAPRARRRPISPRRSRTEITMTLPTPKPPTKERDGAEYKEQRGGGVGDGAWGGEGVGGLAHAHCFGV